MHIYINSCHSQLFVIPKGATMCVKIVRKKLKLHLQKKWKARGNVNVISEEFPVNSTSPQKQVKSTEHWIYIPFSFFSLIGNTERCQRGSISSSLSFSSQAIYYNDHVRVFHLVSEQDLLHSRETLEKTTTRGSYSLCDRNYLHHEQYSSSVWRNAIVCGQLKSVRRGLQISSLR